MELITRDISICPAIPQIRAENIHVKAKANTKRDDRQIPPACGIVLRFQYEGSSYLHEWISEMNQGFLQEYVEIAEE